MKKFKRNCCDGIYNSFDIHFTPACDNDCAHCVDKVYKGIGNKFRPDIDAIFETIIRNNNGYDDVLFLGGEPCLYLDELLLIAKHIKSHTNLKVFVTTAVPKTCYDDKDKFYELIDVIDGINLSVQHHDESIADKIRNTKSLYDRQSFYKSLPNKDKIRINLNIVKPYLHTKEQLVTCLKHYDTMGFNSIKLSEIQHGKEYFTSFEEVFNIDLKSPFYHGCQTYLNTELIENKIKTPVLLKRSCFLCEETLKASFMDTLKVLYKFIERAGDPKYGIIYGDGTLTKNWR